MTWHRIATELNRVHAGTLITTHAGIVAACHVATPAVVTALDPA